MRFQIDDRRVQCAGEHFIAPTATVIGSVEIGHDVSIWFNVVIRGDSDRIILGDRSNVQDCSMLHTDPGFVLELGRNVTVGHKAMLHGCRVGDNSLIGINAVVLNGAKIGSNCLIGANTLISEGKEIPDGSLVVGTPGRIVRQLTNEELGKLAHAADHYVENGRRYRHGFRTQDEQAPSP